MIEKNSKSDETTVHTEECSVTAKQIISETVTVYISPYKVPVKMNKTVVPTVSQGPHNSSLCIPAHFKPWIKLCTYSNP